MWLEIVCNLWLYIVYNMWLYLIGQMDNKLIDCTVP